MAIRKLTSIEFEGMRALLSLAGIRPILQATVSATPGANTSYTVQDNRTRRVLIIHLGAGNGDIRFALDGAATANSLPILPARYVVVDAAKDQTLNFWNTTAAAITVNLAELD